MQSLSLVLDRGLESKISDILSSNIGGKEFSTGLLIGHRTSTAINVVHLARNIQIEEPSVDENAAAKSDDTPTGKKRSGKKSTPPPPQSESLFDEESILQQVSQAIRILPGGLDIVGFFVTSSPTNRKHSENVIAINKSLRSAYKLCSKASNMCGSVTINENNFNSDGRMVLLTLESPSGNNKKPVSATIVDCRPDVQATAPSTPIPFSYQNLRWRQLSTRLIFDVPLFVSAARKKENFLKQFADSVRPWCRRLWNAKSTINGSLRDDDEILSSISSTTSSSAAKKGKKVVEENETDIVDFYFVDDYKTIDVQSPNSKTENGSVSMHIRGTMYCLAFVHQKATVREGVQALKIDALRSLYSRCELHYDGMTILEGEELEPVAVHQFPRRVLAPLSDNNSILLCNDYLFEGDVPGDAVSSFKDLLDIDLRPGSIVDKYERLPSEKTLENLLRSSSLSGTPEGSIDGIDGSQALESDESKKKRVIGNKSSIIYLVLAVVVAILAYLCYFFLGK